MVDAILWLQQFSSPGLDAFFLTVTRLGNEGFYLVFLPLAYWNLDRRFGFRLITLFLLSMFINFMIKDTFQMPRPSGPGIKVPEGAAASGYGFPSGHAQGNTTVWAALAMRYRRRWLTALACIVVGLVSLSRVYLGVHYPADVLGGIAIGLLLTAVFLRFSDACERLRLPVTVKAALAVLVPLAGLFIYRTDGAYRLAGVAAGFAVGHVMHSSSMPIQSAPRLNAAGRALIKSVIGLGVAGALRVLTSPYFPEGSPQVLRFGLIGLWVSFLAPWLFARLGLEQGRGGTMA